MRPANATRFVGAVGLEQHRAAGVTQLLQQRQRAGLQHGLAAGDGAQLGRTGQDALPDGAAPKGLAVASFR